MNDERLRQILRQGDPAEGDGGLTPEEVRAMRRTVLTAIPERKRRLLPVLALAGAVATAVLIAVLLLRPAPAPPRVAAAPTPPAPPIAPAEPAPRPLQEREERGPAPRHHSQHHHRRSAPPVAPAITDTLASLETTDAETTERQVQFSTPGGTRIIWILKSGKASR
jgi:hypothetical protein